MEPHLHIWLFPFQNSKVLSSSSHASAPLFGPRKLIFFTVQKFEFHTRKEKFIIRHFQSSIIKSVFHYHQATRRKYLYSTLNTTHTHSTNLQCSMFCYVLFALRLKCHALTLTHIHIHFMYTIFNVQFCCSTIFVHYMLFVCCAPYIRIVKYAVPYIYIYAGK